MERVIEERRRAREKALEEARIFSLCVLEKFERASIAVFGSYARGDFGEWSDIDVLVVVEDAPSNPLRRLDIVEECLAKAPRVEPIIVTLKEYRELVEKGNPVVVDVREHGVVLFDTLNIFSVASLGNHMNIALHRTR